MIPATATPAPNDPASFPSDPAQFRAALRAARHRLEHLEMVTAHQLAALARWGVVLSVQPAFDTAWGGADGLYVARVGARAAAMNPFGAAATAGALSYNEHGCEQSPIGTHVAPLSRLVGIRTRGPVSVRAHKSPPSPPPTLT